MEQGITFFFEWEVRLMEWLQMICGDIGGTVAGILSMLGEETILVAILGFIYWCYDKEFGKYIGTNIVVGIVWNPMLKNVILRRRPYFDNPSVKCLKPVDSGADIYDISAQGFSFPSGHSTNSAIVYGSMAVWIRKRWMTILAIALPLLVGISRFTVGVHYPTDVLVGWTMGILIMVLMTFLQKRIEKRWVLNLIIFLVSAAGIFYCRTTDYFTGLGVMGGFFLAQPFEERFVGFRNTKSVPRIIFRMLGGFALYFGLNVLLKLPFSEEFLKSATMAAYLVRFVRYTIVAFLVLAVYPLTFDKIKTDRSLTSDQ